jgi:hypothetical protein
MPTESIKNATEYDLEQNREALREDGNDQQGSGG